MTFFEANALVESEQRPWPYPTSPLNIGKVYILKVGEDGFLYRRETEYIEAVGIAEILCNNFTTNIDRWRFSEITVFRKNIS